MADVERRAKGGNEWTNDDLLAYNITVEVQDFGTFFGQPVPILEPSELLTTLNADETTSAANYQALRFMALAMDRIPNQLSMVAEFTAKLLTALGYESDSLVKSVVTLQQMPLFICGQSRHATSDVCLMDMSQILLVVQEDKRHMDDVEPEPQLIAEAIAAFQFNNYKRTRNHGRGPSHF